MLKSIFLGLDGSLSSVAAIELLNDPTRDCFQPTERSSKSGKGCSTNYPLF